MNMKKRTLSTMLVLFLVLCGLAPAKPAQMAGIKLNKTKVTLSVGESVKLKVTGTKKKASFSSSNKAVAKVNKTGKVTAIKGGKATVTAKVAKKSLKCKVTVTALTKYWSKDSATAKKLREYVETVTDKNNKDYIPEDKRIVTFDMDGTLTCETYSIYFDTMMFWEYCQEHKDELSPEVLAKANEMVDPDYKAGPEQAQLFAETYKGMTIEEFYNLTEKYGKMSAKRFNNMTYFDGAYMPMVELVEYLYDNNFTIYVVSGTERTTSRAIIANSPFAKFVSPSHIIGTQFEVKIPGDEDKSLDYYSNYDIGDNLIITGNLIQKNLNTSKVIMIEREIGQVPVLAFGNSGSDTSMMNYAIDKTKNPYLSQSYMIVADDGERDWPGYDWDKKSAEYAGMGYHPVSMKQEFKQIYKDGVEKGDDWRPTEN
ncbi:MAG: haloacid dehalogenase-like hydrolase [Eubacterium sp.]|nr:haloacid dehalogenase-like hydrolase [Eubacterium sp.]